MSKWLVASVLWGLAWAGIGVGIVMNEQRWMAGGLFLAVGAATAAFWLIAENVATRVASAERIEVEKMAHTVAQVLAEEYKLGRLPRHL